MGIVVRNTQKTVSVKTRKSNVEIESTNPGGSARWGKITGDMTKQSDLEARLLALDKKATKAIKTAKAAL